MGETDEEEPGAREEAEFSLDGRLAAIKHWRGFVSHRVEEADDVVDDKTSEETRG